MSDPLVHPISTPEFASDKAFIFTPDELAEKYSATEQTFDVELPAGEKFKFRVISDHEEIELLKKKSAAFIKRATTGGFGPEWEKQFGEYVKTDSVTLAMAYALHFALVAPKWSPGAFLKLAKLNGWLFDGIVRKFEERTSRMSEYQLEVEVSVQGEDYGGTSPAG